MQMVILTKWWFHCELFSSRSLRNITPTASRFGGFSLAVNKLVYYAVDRGELGLAVVSGEARCSGKSLDVAWISKPMTDWVLEIRVVELVLIGGRSW